MIVGKAIPKPYNRDASRIITGNLPYAQLPTGGGTWANGGALTLSGGNFTISAGNLAIGSGYGVSSTDYITFNLAATPPHTEGMMHWDTDEGTVEIGYPGGNVMLQVGQEGLARVKNNSGVDIKNGNVVYTTGSLGQRLTVGLADSTDSDKIFILGIATEDIDDNEVGYVAIWGKVKGDATQPINTSAFSEGDKLYLGPSGTWTATHPPDPTHGVVVVGWVKRSHATEGELYITNPQIFTIGNNYNGTLRQSVINKSTGNAAGSSFTVVNDQGYRASLTVFGNSHATLPNIAGLYNEGYGDTAYVTDGNKSHKWYVDPTDSHDFSSLNYLSMELTPAGDLDMLRGDVLLQDNKAVKLGTGDDASIFYDGTDLKIVTDNVAASDLVVDCGTNKTLELAEVVWDDLRTPVQAIRLSGAQPPAETAYRGSYVLSFPSNADKTMYFIVQLPHNYKLGTDLEFHVHYILPVAGTGGGAENIKWDFTHSWADIGSAQPAETTVSATLDMQNQSADTHYLGEVAATIDGSGISGVSSMVLCSLTRDTTVANDYASAVYVMEVDFHYQIDTMGSRQETVK